MSSKRAMWVERNNRDTHYLPRCPGHEIGHQQSVKAGSSPGRLVGIYASRRANSHDLTDRTDDFHSRPRAILGEPDPS